jgi:hypothetical protein
VDLRWHVTYTPGSWIVLAGPVSVVALDSRSSSQAGLAAELWSAVDASAKFTELISRLALVEVTRLPGLAVLYFERDGERDVVRALLRGDVRVLSESGQTVAHGEDVLTWQEVRLADLSRLEVDLGGDPADDGLPLVWGAVRAGRLRLRAEQGQPGGDTPGRRLASIATIPPDAPEPVPVPVPEPKGEPEPKPEPEPEPKPASDPTPAPVAEEGAGAEAEDHADPLDELDDDDADTVAATAPMPPPFDAEAFENADTAAMEIPRFAVARLRAPDGSTIDLDRPVLIGRAPSDSGFENAQPHLLTVPSPSQDISRTHVLVAPDRDAVVVTDLHSTNGTTVVRPGPGVERLALPSGQSVSVEVGSVLELGDEVAILIDAAP